MLIMREPTVEKKTQFRIRMSDRIYNEITEYCSWAGIRYRDFFIEQACLYIFNNDDEWQEHKQAKKIKESCVAAK